MKAGKREIILACRNQSDFKKWIDEIKKLQEETEKKKTKMFGSKGLEGELILNINCGVLGFWGAIRNCSTCYFVQFTYC